MIKKLRYPSRIKKEDGIYYVDFIDFEEAFTDAETLEEAFSLADDVLYAVATSYINSGKKLPNPSYNYEERQGEYIYISSCSINTEREKNKSIKKTLSIPKWLNDEANAKGINFSRVLREALIEEIE